MQPLAQLTQELACSLINIDPLDLTGLVALHTRFQQARDHDLADAATREQWVRLAGTAERRVEQIILNEVPDVNAALREVTDAVTALQQLAEADGVDEGEVAPPPIAAAAPTVAAPAPHATPPAEAEHDALVESTLGPDELALIHEFITEARGHLELAEAEVLKLEDAPDDLEAVNAAFRSFHTIKGGAGFLNLKQIGTLAHANESLLDLARHARLRMEGAAVDVTLEALDAMKLMVDQLQIVATSGVPIAVQPQLPALLARINACAAGEAAAPSTPPAPVPTKVAPLAEPAVPVPAPRQAATAPSAPAATSASAAGTQQTESTVKVATDRLDSLINMVGELVIAQSMVNQDMQALASQSPRLVRNMAQLGKLTRELQDLSMSMRMVPIQGVFQKMARLVRDLGRKCGKELELIVIGGETELDRNVVEAISDPLVHMVRNSVDHGLEPAEDRVTAGKPRAGRVELKAYHQAGNIVIDITDDGRGLNKARILKKARDAGIVRDGQELTDQEIFKLIFHAGLSTAEKVTDVSGRGVGMDVVRKNVEALRGRIDIVSTEGKGSTFTIRLPLTLAVIDGMVVRVGNERYIIPITSIEQSIQPRGEQLSTVQSRGELCMVRGDLLPLYRLHRIFGVEPRTPDPTQGLVVIVQDEARRVCLLVDELLGQQQVVIKSLGEGVSVAGISGGAILGDGNVSLILDIPGLLALGATGHGGGPIKRVA